MKSKVGVWIDHSRAIIMIKIGRNWSRNEIMASMGNYNMMQMNGTSKHVFGHRDRYGDDKIDRHNMEHLKQFYDEVISHIYTSDSILLMGPGAAKKQLFKRMDQQHLSDKIVSVEVVDKMSDYEIKMKMKEIFMNQHQNYKTMH